MLYRKNLRGWERTLRIAGAAAMVACGWFGLGGSPLGWVLIAAGAVTALTAWAGYCPMCAIGRRKAQP